MKLHEMIVNESEFYQEYPSKTARQQAKHQAQQDKLDAGKRALEALAIKNKEEKMAKLYDGKPFKVTLPVRVGRKIENREFTIDNTIEQRRFMNSIANIGMVDLDSVGDSGQGAPAYAVDEPPTMGKSTSIPKRLHGLTPRTRRNPGYAPEDLRRQAYKD